MRRRKNVHAFIEGYLVDVGEADKQAGFTWTESYYNPYFEPIPSKTEKQDDPSPSAKFVDLWIDEKDSHIMSHKSK